MAAQDKMDLITLTPQDKLYPTSLCSFLRDEKPKVLTALGNLGILKNKTLALFCSKKCPGEIILATYDLIKNLRDTGVTVVSGFHSPMEQECLNILLAGKQPVIVCPARSIEGMRIRTEYKKPLEQGRLLLLSPFVTKQRRISADRAIQRNRFVAALADIIFVPYAAPNSRTEEFCRQVMAWEKPLFTLKSKHNTNFIELGARIIEEWREE